MCLYSPCAADAPAAARCCRGDDIFVGLESNLIYIYVCVCIYIYVFM